MATKVYFFKGGAYIRYGSGGNSVEPCYPKPVAGNWPGVAEAGFGSGFDSDVNWGNGKAYLFLASQYLRYDIGSNTAEAGYTLPVWGGRQGPDCAGSGWGFGPAVGCRITQWEG